MSFENDPDFASRMDREDPLRPLRDEFLIPKNDQGRDRIYFCGNSLGLQPRGARGLLEEILELWAQKAVEGHFSGAHPWLPYHEFVTEKLARLVGAAPDEVVAMNSLTVNLHLMMVSFYRPTNERYRILIERGAFPSDRYAVLSQTRFHGLDPADALIEAVPRAGEHCLRGDDLVELIDREGEKIALILLPGVQYYTGQALDLDAITRAGHLRGCIVGFDLAHAAGNLRLRLHDLDVDFAAWCSYKYLNAGPGATAGCFVHERHARRFKGPRFAGWWGHDKNTRFEMPDRFSPLPGAEGWQISNPPILATAPLIASLEQFDRAGMQALRAKSEKLTGYLDFLLRTRLGKRVSIITPASPEQRGCQLSITLNQGPEASRSVYERLTDLDIVCDWREPDVIRVAPVPLYNQFTEVFDFVERLEALL